MSNWMVTYNSSDLMHYGVKGMEWRHKKGSLRERLNGNYYKNTPTEKEESKTKSKKSSISSSNNTSSTKNKKKKSKTQSKKVDKKLLIQRSNRFMAQLTGYNPDIPKAKKPKEPPISHQVRNMLLGKQAFDPKKMLKHLSDMSPEMRKKTLLSIRKTRPAMYQALIRAGSPYKVSGAKHNIAKQAEKKVSFIQHEIASEKNDILHSGKKGMKWGVKNKKAKTGKKKGISDKADKTLSNAHKNLGKASYKDALKHYKTVMTAKPKTMKAWLKKHNVVDPKTGKTLNTKQYQKYCLNAVKKAQSGQKKINAAKADANVAKNITNRALGKDKRYSTTAEAVKGIPTYKSVSSGGGVKKTTPKVKKTTPKKTTPKKTTTPTVSKKPVANTLRNRLSGAYYKQ
ncbi:MAG: hypothetical protein J6Y02_23585 [Pseudobutyrivibrio sp.]|nr:hypothetical protein [Pseudobutyrivibrio sp.]